jgi:hypothetical protein
LPENQQIFKASCPNFALISQNMKTAVTLTPQNATALARYADLVGVSPQEFLNAFLAEFLLPSPRNRPEVTHF